MMKVGTVRKRYKERAQIRDIGGYNRSEILWYRSGILWVQIRDIVGIDQEYCVYRSGILWYRSGIL